MLLLAGIVIFSIFIIVYFIKGFILERVGDLSNYIKGFQVVDAFQGVARGGMEPMDRGDYDRPRYVKETLLYSYPQESYAATMQGRPDARPMQALTVITPDAGTGNNIVGSGPTLNFSGIEIYQGANRIPPGGNNTKATAGGGAYDHSSCGGSWCHMLLNDPQSVRIWPNIYHSTDSYGYHWVDYFYPNRVLIDKIIFYNRGDWNDRAASYEIRVYPDYNTARNAPTIYRFRLNSNLIQTFTINLDCPSGFTLTGNKYDTNTQCYKNCASGETYSNGRCYKPCNPGFVLDGGLGGTCRRNCPNGYTLSGNTCYKNCAPDVELDIANCYSPCKAGEDDTRPPKCYRACPSGYRLIEDKCFPNDPATYLPIAWMGPIISQADTTQNVGLCLPLGVRNGDKVGVWGSGGTIPGDTKANDWDVVWAYTEDMQLVNMKNRKCLDTSSPYGTGEGLNPITWDCHKGAWQKWFIDSEQRIRSVAAPDLCLTAVDYTTETSGSQRVILKTSQMVILKKCTADGNKFQRWKIPGPRVELQGVATTTLPPALPEPINRDGFIGTQAEPEHIRKPLAERTTDDAF